MRGLTIHQPYAHLIAIGKQRVVNRDWVLKSHGPILIHAGQNRSWMTPEYEDRYGTDLVYGAVIATAVIINCLHRLTIEERAGENDYWRELHEHEHTIGPYCWLLDDVVRLRNPVPWRGAQGLWKPSKELMGLVNEELPYETTAS